MKNYMLRINEHSLYFKSLENVKNWFIKNDVNILLDDEEQTYSLDTLEDIFGIEIRVVNESLIERGDDYCSILLEEFEFED